MFGKCVKCEAELTDFSTKDSLGNRAYPGWCTRCDEAHKKGWGQMASPETSPTPDVARKADAGKTQLDLLPMAPLVEIGKVLTFGAQKYDPHNWRRGLLWSRIIASTLRHFFAWIGGEKDDPETGLPHLAHAGCNILFLLEYELTGTGTDDRYKPEEKVGSTYTLKLSSENPNADR